jgi:hypothetical protein
VNQYLPASVIHLKQDPTERKKHFITWIIGSKRILVLDDTDTSETLPLSALKRVSPSALIIVYVPALPDPEQTLEEISPESKMKGISASLSPKQQNASSTPAPTDAKPNSPNTKMKGKPTSQPPKPRKASSNPPRASSATVEAETPSYAASPQQPQQVFFSASAAPAAQAQEAVSPARRPHNPYIMRNMRKHNHPLFRRVFAEDISKLLATSTEDFAENLSKFLAFPDKKLREGAPTYLLAHKKLKVRPNKPQKGGSPLKEAQYSINLV